MRLPNFTLKIRQFYTYMVILSRLALRSVRKSPKQQTSLQNRGRPKVLNDTKIDPKLQRASLMLFRTNLVSFRRTSRCPLFHKPVSWLGLFTASYSKITLENHVSGNCLHQQLVVPVVVICLLPAYQRSFVMHFSSSQRRGGGGTVGQTIENGKETQI